jgi:hypothetical protein
VLALLRKPRTLELLVFQRGRHGHLLGPVALGSHPRGLSQIRWNLRVGGRKLRAGSYPAELVATFGRGITSNGPSGRSQASSIRRGGSGTSNCQVLWMKIF